jgi:hypothetical protein
MDGHRSHARVRWTSLARSVLAVAILWIAGARSVAAAATDPATRWPAGGPAIATARAIADDHWGFPACSGAVTVRWGPLAPGLLGRSTWSNPLAVYGQPSRNTDCVITLSSTYDWDWTTLCSIVVHEMGHLTGHQHSDDPHDIMAAIYGGPLPACLTAPEPPEGGPADPAPAAAAAVAAPPTAAVPSRPVVTPRPAARPAKARAAKPARRTRRRHR